MSRKMELPTVFDGKEKVLYINERREWCNTSVLQTFGHLHVILQKPSNVFESLGGFTFTLFYI